jgi:replication factor C subunit 1
VYWINQAPCNQDPSWKASKYFASKTEKGSDVEMADAATGKSAEKSTGKRKIQKGSKELEDDKKSLPAKKLWLKKMTKKTLWHLQERKLQ